MIEILRNVVQLQNPFLIPLTQVKVLYSAIRIPSSAFRMSHASACGVTVGEASRRFSIISPMFITFLLALLCQITRMFGFRNRVSLRVGSALSPARNAVFPFVMGELDRLSLPVDRRDE